MATHTGSMTSQIENDAGGKPVIVNGSLEALLTPELLYKMNKKIAQLTKVVYGLNTRAEELEGRLENSKEAEEKAKTQNQDLQHRMNSFKSKIENEMGRLRDLEKQAQQAQVWKKECEMLKRRLDADGGGRDIGDVAALSLAREELEQVRRREAAIQFELDQARHAINNLKAHHDFIMRERDAQQIMESEKIVLEWQSRMAEMESRFKCQTRRLTDDVETARSECEMLRGRMMRSTSSAAEEGILRDQIRIIQLKHDSERREWEMKLKTQSDQINDEKLKLTDEKIELMRKVRSQTQEREGEREDLEQRLSAAKEMYEQRIRELSANQTLLQRLIDDKEADFEVKLKTKVVEWKSEWDLAEEGLREEIRKLKTENLKLQTEVTGLNFSLDNEGLSFIGRIQKLEDDLAEKTNELDLKTNTFESRLKIMKDESEQLLEDKQNLECLLHEEKERTKVKLKNQEIMNEKAKIALQNRYKQAQEKEKPLKMEMKKLEEETIQLKKEKEELITKLNDAEKKWKEKLEKEVKILEVRIKQKVDRVWIEKMKKTEENAANDLDRMKDARRRREESLKREIEVAQNAEEKNKTWNEELKQKLKTLRENDLERAKMMRKLEDELEHMRRKDGEEKHDTEKELGEQEQKYQNHIDDLTLKLASKQQEVADIANQLTSAREASSNNVNEVALQIEVEDMKKMVKLKEDMAESIKVELQYAKNENEISKMKIQRLDEDLSQTKDLVNSLQDQNNASTMEISSLKELESKVKHLEEELRKGDVTRKDLQETIDEIEGEREDELKIVQDALDEAAQEREELILTFEKELNQVNETNSGREAKMLEDFEWKLSEMEKGHKKRLEEKERQMENTLQRVNKHADGEETRQKMEKQKNEINAKWEDKLRSECSRLKAELDDLHSEEKHLAVESIKVQKEQEIHSLKTSWELSQEEMTKEISSLKDSLTEKDAFYHKEMESLRTISDRDIWDLRMKLQKLTESSYDKQQQMEEKHREDMERSRVDYEDRIRELEAQIATREAQAGIDLIGELERNHKEQLQHIQEHHRLSMERLREELESDKEDAVEEVRLLVTANHEYAEASLKEQINEYASSLSQCREELETLGQTLSFRDESLRTLRGELEQSQELHRGSNEPGSGQPYAASLPPSGLSSSQFSLASSTDSQGSRNSQDRFYLPENSGILENHEEQRGGNTGILGKVFGGGWFAPTKTREGNRRGSTPLSNKKAYGS